ncbi:hypothetical protein N510_000542 [Firmicutes bacterium ASF500]|nr:hypothetical protein N510_000542 [Firmicutes bacterium ASF500]
MEKQFKPVPDVECLKYHGTQDRPDIKIFVSHRIDLDSETIDNPLYIPVRCGAVFDEREGVTMLGDDTGDNISEKRMIFNEFTVIYWAWKNIEADYYGLCHYRRYLSFFNQDLPFYPLRQGMADSMSSATLKYYGFLDAEKIESEIVQHDMHVPYQYSIEDSSICDHACKSIKEQWEKHCSSYLKPEHFDIMLELIKKRSPAYYKSALTFINGKMFRGFNCFIFKKELFHKMCEFIFPILFEFSTMIDCSNFSITQNRAPAYLGEWLFSIFIYHHQLNSRLLIKERQLICFLNTGKRLPQLNPQFADRNVAIAVPLNDGNRSLVGVTLQSLLENTNQARNYDIILLEQSMDENEQSSWLKRQHNIALQKLTDSFSNVSIRFYDPKDELCELDIRKSGSLSGEEQYYIHLAPWIFEKYSKIVWLQDGILLNCDIAELYDKDISESYAAAVKNPIFDAMINGYIPNANEKFSSVLQMDNLFNYVSIELTLMNLELIRRNFKKKDVVQYLMKQKCECPPPDCFNHLFGSKISFLHQEWNRIECCSLEYFKIKEFFPAEVQTELSQATNPKAINLRGMVGGWVPQQSQSAKLFWSYARNTSFYEELIFATVIPPAIPFFPAQPYRSRARRLADKFIPVGTRRRELAKCILPKGSMRWKFCKKIYYFIFRG